MMNSNPPATDSNSSDENTLQHQGHHPQSTTTLECPANQIHTLDPQNLTNSTNSTKQKKTKGSKKQINDMLPTAPENQNLSSSSTSTNDNDERKDDHQSSEDFNQFQLDHHLTSGSSSGKTRPSSSDISLLPLKNDNHGDDNSQSEHYTPLFPHLENPYYCRLASKFLILEKHVIHESASEIKQISHEIQQDPLDMWTTQTNSELECLEMLALEIIKFNALLKLRMDVAKERREKIGPRRSLQYLLVSRTDVYLMDVCVLLYNVLQSHRFEEKLQHELLEHVRNAMIHVYFNLGELCYFIWEETKSSICLNRCMTLLNEKKQQANGILSDQDLALLLECLIYGMVDTLNNQAGSGTSDMETKFVKPMQECLSKFCHVENIDEWMNSKTVRCDMATIAKCILHTRVNCMESLVNYKYGHSNDMEKFVIKAIQFVNTQSTFDRSHLELQQYFDMDEFYCRLGAMCTGRGQLFDAVQNYNNSLKIRRRFYIRSLVNKYIAISNQAMESASLLTLAVYYILLSQWECSKFKKLTEQHWSVEPFYFLKSSLINPEFETEKVFGEDVQDPLRLIQEQDLEEHLVRKWLWNIEKLLEQKKQHEPTFKELIENELKLMDKLNEIAQEEAYLNLFILKIIQSPHYVDVEIKTVMA
ncbi:hypothetical protein C9374_003971 [Naegleria lovaniensis]|uniref:Uncharacterized protein n=1 Tax=Naegleria lovaniensis TaxID=51637 RepID=A0AA88KSI7_NAELO|nr:uncharacterized protein C9374_003971 [Naegleria lovaniensis]KAG2394207.1 hypothetical protein C9374_003971 [Naegleria lovaniensis]